MGGGASAAEFFSARGKLGETLEKHSQKDALLDMPGLAKDLKSMTGRVQGEGMRDIHTDQGDDVKKVGAKWGIIASDNGLRWERIGG